MPGELFLISGGSDSSNMASFSLIPEDNAWFPLVIENGTRDGRRCGFALNVFDADAGYTHKWIAFEAEGLDPNKYGMFCSDTWWEKDGEEVEEGTEGAVESTRLGIRYEELLAFIMAAI